MRKIILLIFCALSFLAFAQKPSMKKAILPSNHISFMGISLGENLKTFKKELKTIKYSVKEYQDEYEPYTTIIGNYGSITNFNFDVEYDYDNNNIIAFIGKKEYNNVNQAEVAFNQLKLYVSQRNHIGKSENLRLLDIDGKERNIYVKEVINKNGNVLGHIYLTLNKTYDEINNNNNNISELEIKYVDNLNRSIYDNSLSYNKPIKYKTNYGYIYDISEFAKSLFSRCTLEIYDNYLKISGIKDMDSYEVYALDEDRRNILDTLFGSYTSNESRADIFQIYISLAFIKSKEYVISTTNSEPKAVSLYCDIQNNKKSYTNYGIANFFFDSVMGKDLVNFYKSSGQYDYFIDCLKKGSRNGSSSGYSTNWDGLNDAQKAVIHEHDNAR